MKNDGITVAVLLLCSALSVWAFAAEGIDARADKIIDTAGVEGGFVVHVGCGNGDLAAALRVGDKFIVQGLTDNPETVAIARERVKSAGLYGPVSISLYDGESLPYVDNLVNLLVVSGENDLKLGEIERVLVPGGAALFEGRAKKAGLKTKRAKGLRGWRVYRKQWPDTIDEWTHYMHDPMGSFLSDDRTAGMPGGLRWTGGPLWARAHDQTASMHAMVSANGRVFYVMDEGLVASVQLPAHHILTARDAFNGTVLWKRPLKDWFNHLYPLKSGPGWMPRRLVAIKDRVYLAPGIGQNLLCLDAVTGEVVREYEDTATTFELIVSDGMIMASVDPDRKPIDYNQQHPNCWKERNRANKQWGWKRDTGLRELKAIDAETGKVLWEKQMPVAPMTTAADGKLVSFYDGDCVYGVSQKDGDELWKTDVSDMALAQTGYAGPRLILCEDKVVFSPEKHIFVIDSRNGKVIWSVKDKATSGHWCLEDLYVINGKVWVLGREGNGIFNTYDLETGKGSSRYANPIESFYIHQRCYPGRATTRYLLPPMMGNTVYDIDKDEWMINHWIRGGCTYGMMPANGMIYSVPHACACYYQSKLNGFNAVAPEPQPAQAPPAEKRLLKGPAYGDCESAAKSSKGAWPTFRHDNTRSGCVDTRVRADVGQLWKAELGTKLSQPVVVGGTLYVSAVDAHTVYAIDTDSGEEIWHFITGGRVDSPPTIYKGMAIFGCADGCVYALRADDGVLAWMFQAAPTPRKLMSFCRPESVWPLPGGTLIQDDKLYCIAGRTMFLDGGLRMLIIDPQTGELVYENVMDRRVPGTDNELQDLIMGKHMPVAMPDILSSDGQYVYMKSQTFTMDGERVRVRPQRPDTQYDEEVHLFSPISFLDDSWQQRTYWLYGRAAGEGWAEFQLPPKRVPYGRIMCLDEENAYAYGRDPELMCNCSISEYRLYSAKKVPARKVGIPTLEGNWVEGKYPTDFKLAAQSVDWKQLSNMPMEKLTALDYNWINEEPDVMAKAMVLASDLLFVAGPRDVVDERETWGFSNQQSFHEKMEEQERWLNGDHGCFLQVFGKADGKKLAEKKLSCAPVLDGLIAADGKLYLATEGGSLLCLGAE